MLTKSLASVLGDHGIRVNTILPGAIDTDMAAPLMQDKPTLKYYKERIPLHRLGQPEEIAGAAAFLLSDDASYCTSSELLVDGGFITNAEYM